MQITCTVSKGDEPITLQWYKDDIPLTSSSSFMINPVNTRMSLLVLSDVGMEHAGKYSCVAYNPVGESQVSAKLRVKGKFVLIKAIVRL